MPIIDNLAIMNALLRAISPIAGAATDSVYGLLKDKLSGPAKDAGGRLIAARDEYSERVSGKLADKYARTRQLVINKLSQIQTRAILQVTEQGQLGQILTMSLELTIQAYYAKSEQDLNMILDSVTRIESFLGRYENDRRHRSGQRVVAVVISVFLFIGLLTFTAFSPLLQITEQSAVPILKIPISVLLWSALGSITSMLYRFNKASDAELQDPLRYLISRPLFGVLMGTLIFLAVQVGFLTVAPGNPEVSLGTNQLIWLISFLVGFSDRFSDNILKSLIGKFGGDETSGLTTPLTPSSPVPAVNLLDAIQGLGTRIGEIAKKPTIIPGMISQKQKDMSAKTVQDSKLADEAKSNKSNGTEHKPVPPVIEPLPINPKSNLGGNGNGVHRASKGKKKRPTINPG